MPSSSLRLTAFALVLAASFVPHAARAAATFYTQENRNQYSSADWSSDLGPDHDVAWKPDASSLLQLGGNGTGHSSRPVYYQDTGFSLDWELEPRGGEVGHTFAGGRIDAPEAGDVEGRIFNYQLYAELGDNSGYYGIGAFTNIRQTHHFSLDQAFAPLYFALRYTITVVTDDAASVVAEVTNSRYGYPSYYPVNGWLTAGTHHYEGVITGMFDYFDYWSGPFSTLSYFGASLSVSDGGGMPGSGRADMTVELTYSSSPITEFPGSSNSVPESLPMLPVIAAALAGLVALRRPRVA